MATPQHPAHPGDIVEVDGRSVGSPGRTGEIVSVLGEPGHEHYLIRWEDDHESILYPSGSTRIKIKHEHV